MTAKNEEGNQPIHPIRMEHNRRWYDDVRHMTAAVHMSKYLPIEIQCLIAETLNQQIDRYRKEHRTDPNQVSLGAKHVLGLYKSGLGQRWYDANRQYQRALTMMMALPQGMLSDYALRVIDVSHYIESQRKRQASYNQPLILDAKEIHNILKDNYVTLGQDEHSIKIRPNTLSSDPNTHIVAKVDKDRSNYIPLRRKKAT